MPFCSARRDHLAGKGIAFERTYIDLTNKPDWFLKLSPTGKVPLLQVNDDVLFESSVIAEYLDEVYGPQLHPADPLTKAQHRAWMEFASTTLGSLWSFYTAPTSESLENARKDVLAKIARLEEAVSAGPYFAGSSISLVDAAFGPVFRYFPVLESLGETGWFDVAPKVQAWSRALLARPSVVNAVQPGYADKLKQFIKGKGGLLAAKV